MDAGERFLDKLAGVTDPERKRKIIGNEFIAVFDDEAKKIFEAEKHVGEEVAWLVQGTLYPDVIESSSVHGPVAYHQEPSQRRRPAEDMKLKLISPCGISSKTKCGASDAILGCRRRSSGASRSGAGAGGQDSG